MQPEQSVPAPPPAPEPVVGMPEAEQLPPPSSQASSPLKRRALIGGAIIVIVVIIIALLFAGHKKQGTPAKRSASGFSSAYILEPNATPTRFKNTNALQACNLVPQADLAQAGYTIDGSSGSGTFSQGIDDVTMNYFRSEGDPSFSVGQLILPGVGDANVNSCMYLLTKGFTIMLGLYQPPYVAPGSFMRQVTSLNAQTLPTSNGSKVWSYPNSLTSTTDFDVVGPDGQTGVEFYVDPVANKDPAALTAAQQAVLKIVTSNLASQLQRPGGAPSITYTAQSFSASHPHACDLISNGDFKTMYGVDASPLATEAAGGPGNVTISGKSYPYVDDDCYIQSFTDPVDTIGNSASPQYLSVRMETYTATNAAHYGYSALMQRATQSSQIHGVGDESFFAVQSESFSDAYVIRKGRTIVTLSPASIGGLTLQDPTQVVNELLVLGKKVVAELPAS